MKKFLVLILSFMLFFGSSSVLTLKAVITDAPIPVNYCAYSSGQTVFIQWNYSCPSGFSCYIEIYENENMGGIWGLIKTVSASNSPQTFTGQSYGRHQYKLRAKLTYSFITMYSGYTNPFDCYVLHTPTGLTVSVNPDLLFANGNPYLTLRWNAVDSNATSVWVWRRLQGVIDFPTIIAKVPSSATSYDDTTVLYNTTYDYTIQVISKDDTNIHDDASGYTPFVSKLTLPEPPTNYKANAIDKTVYMSWSHSKACDGYKIYKWGKVGMMLGWFIVATLNKNTFSFNTTVADYGSYNFKVTAYNASGDSAKSPTKDVYALRKPTGLNATPLSSTTAKLTWDPLDSNATKVVISYSTNGSTYFAIGSLTLPQTEANVTGLSPNTQYWFKIKVSRDSNESAMSDPALAKTLPTGVPPAAPSELEGIALSCNRVELTWKDNSDNEDGFKIERKEGAGSFSEIATVAQNVVAFTDSAVSAEKTYTYRIKAYNSFGNSATLECLVVTPPCGPVPNSPTNLTAVLISTTEVRLKWTDNSDNEEYFKLERKIEGGSYSVVDTIASNVVETLNGGLLPGTKYYYRIRAYNMYGYSNYSNEATVTTPLETAIPDAPSGLTATVISCSEVSLSWTDNSINETNFIVERKLEGEDYQVIAGTIAANTTTYSDSNVEEGKKYYYRVKATNVNGDSAYSGEVSIVVPPCGYPPAAPSNLAVTAASTTEIQVNFKDNSDNEDGFKIERKEPGGTYELIAVLSANTTSHKDAGLTANTIYYYRVCAFNTYGTSPYSNEANATTQKELTIPNKPTNLMANAVSSTEIKINWTDFSDNEDGFKIERKTSGGSYAEVKTLPANTTIFLDSGLTPNTTYYYRVRAYNAAGNSDYSNEANATTMKEIEQIIIRLYIDKTTYYVNDSLKTMDVAPIIKESRTLLPIRYVAEALGADVAWDANERKVTITFKGTTIELWIDKNSAKVNGEYKLIDATNPKVTPIIIPPGRTMLPIRFIAENLGCLVEWDATLREVKITYPAP